MDEKSKTLRLEVITPDTSVFNDDVEFVLVRALDGDPGIMPNHAPLIASLRIWPLTYTKNGTEKQISVAKGFLEVSGNKVTVVTPAAELPENIDVKRAQAAKERAERRLENKAENIDVERAELALRRALLRLDVVKTFSGK